MGATLFTVMLVLPGAEPPKLSATETLTAKVPSAGRPAGLSRYLWFAEKLKTPAARLTMVLLVPSPQLIVILCVSPESGSANVPVRVAWSPSLILVAVKLKVETAGGG